MKLGLKFSLLSLSLLTFTLLAHAQTQAPQYKKNEIRDTRYGNDAKQAAIQKAYELDQMINGEIFGQEFTSQAFRDKLVQYLEGFGQRNAEPVAINLMGLPGIGKTAMVKLLAKSGIQVLSFDAQKYATTGDVSFHQQAFADELAQKFVMQQVDPSKPFAIVVEEIDKAPEIDAVTGAEKTQKVIGTLNQILSEGKISSQFESMPLDLSNAFVVTTMNLAPSEITHFSKEALGQEKSFYDFTIDDFQKFHEWVLSHDAAVAKLLSRLFRSNTVSRAAPLSILVKPLTREDYRKVTVKTSNNAIKRSSKNANAKARLDIEITDKLIDFLNKQTTYAPSGARNTVTKTDILVEQLINYSKRAIADENNKDSLLLPRKITLDYDEQTGKARIKVIPLKIVKNKELKEAGPFEFEVEFSRQTGQFVQPTNIVRFVPALPTGEPKEEVILKKDIKASRFPPQSRKAKGLATYINQDLFGQQEFSQIMESEMNQYMARPTDAPSAPMGVIFAGFPGIGKSEMIRLTGDFLEIPIIKINLQQYTSDSPDSVGNLMRQISQEVDGLRATGKTKYILLFEELDKIFELDPITGLTVNRPVMSVVKDILNNGQTEYTLKNDSGSTQKISLDVRDAFVSVTMNFAVDRFDFTADPRLTTIEDVVNAWQNLSTRLADLKKMLGSMFLPDTVNRLITRMNILKPLEAADYRKVIAKQIDIVLDDRFTDSNFKDIGQITVETTPRYRQYLFNESVVPSEGARFTANVSRSLINMDVEALTKKIPRNGKFAAQPLVFQLDYSPSTQTVSGSIIAGKKKSQQLNGVYERAADLNFPPLSMSGKIPKSRLITTLHEFGHAYASLRLGIPIEHVVVVPPSNGTGGFVKYRGQMRSANDYIARIYSAMASRAMERVMLSANPNAPTSVLDITAGASNDILQATKMLFHVLKELGFDSLGGVMERMGVEGPARYANFADLPHEVVEALGQILRDMENTLVRDFLSAHPKEWYVDKIVRLGRAGAMTERQFFELVEQTYPGDNWQRIEQDSMIFKLFKGKIKESSSQEEPWAATFKSFKARFEQSVEQRLHGIKAQKRTSSKGAVGLSCRKLLGL